MSFFCQVHLVVCLALRHHLHQLALRSPSCGLGDPKSPGQLDAGDAFIRLDDQIHRSEPESERQIGRLENCAGGQRNLVTAGRALVKAPVGDFAIAPSAAARASETLWPAQSKQGRPASLLASVQLTKPRLTEPLLKLNLVEWQC